MAKRHDAFLDPRIDRAYQDVAMRTGHSREFIMPLSPSDIHGQAERCTNCGVPPCHNQCPVNNLIPDWNDLVYRGKWHEALVTLHKTNNFPEFTGRVCPAPCETGCVQYFDTLVAGGDAAVTIKTIECEIVDRGWREGWILPQPAAVKTGFEIAVIGSGPAGMACAQQLARMGHTVTIYEKNEAAGGLLRFGIPDFKMEKYLIDRRVDQMEKEGVRFVYGAHIGVNVDWQDVASHHDAVVMAGGSEHPRDVEIPGRDLDGIHFAMKFLPQENRYQAALRQTPTLLRDAATQILAKGKNVVVIGGGDTGSDCIGTSVRQGAHSVTQLEIMPPPPVREDKSMVWPGWPAKERISTSQKEAKLLAGGFHPHFSVEPIHFHGENGRVQAVECVRVERAIENGRPVSKRIPGTEFTIQGELVLLATGFLHPTFRGMLEQSGVGLVEQRLNVAVKNYRTSVPKVYAAGDMHHGQSIVVRAIDHGRKAAAAVDHDLVPVGSELYQARRNYPRGSRAVYFERNPQANPAFSPA